MNRKLSIFFILSLFSFSIIAQTLLTDVSYISANETDKYMKERCKLDVYYPTEVKDYPVIVWFHGGGLEGGEKYIPDELKNQGIGIVAVNYRLSPKATAPAYIEDAAAAVAWTFENMPGLGADTNNIYVAGHSAGGYLALMVGLDKSYLHTHNIDANQIKGLIPISGQTNTHYTIKKEKGLSMEIPYLDKYAPITHARKDAPPILNITGSREKEIPARYEENAHLQAILKQIGHQETTLYELQGFNHGTVCIPAYFLMTEWIKEKSKQEKQ